MLFATQCRAEDREYGIREDQPRTGSHIRRQEVQGSRIPINKRYPELNQEEKDQLNRMYEHIEPGDEPPFPVGGLKPVLDSIRKVQAKLRVNGQMTLFVNVSATGEATGVKVLSSPSDEMTKYGAMVLMLTKYKPALCGGINCQMEYPFYFNFEIK